MFGFKYRENGFIYKEFLMEAPI